MENHISDINTTEIKHILDNHTPRPEGKFKFSSVVLPIFVTENGSELLFSKRSMDLKRQPGDICFPGGHHENNETAEETAIRETYEELGIKKENIEIIGRPDYMLTKYGAYVIPFIGFLKNIDEKDFIINPDDFPFHMIYGGKNYKFAPIKEYHYFYDYNGIYIWGLTAKIIKNVAEILSNT